jgi:hypothetical protein|tara:strand:+ start:188 stop:460 length:273 start_codon:yes stop_codon:yes gene_type:complete
VKAKNKVIEVQWEDAWIDTDDILITKAKKLKPIMRSTIGWLVADNENELILSTDIFHSKKERKYVNAIMVVPKGMIVEYWEYETKLKTGV